MRFHKNVPEENREFLREMLKEYEKETAMTTDERQELHEWVASGRSPYENGDFIHDESGCLMDFVNADRFVKDQIEWFQGLSEEEKEALLHENDTDVDVQDISAEGNRFIFPESEEELPFQ